MKEGLKLDMLPPKGGEAWWRDLPLEPERSHSSPCPPSGWELLDLSFFMWKVG